MTEIRPLVVKGNRYCQEDDCRSFARWSARISATFHKFLCDRHVEWYR